MDEYISKAKFVELMCKKAESNLDLFYADRSNHYHDNAIAYNMAADEAYVFPSADVQPVKHGKWEETHISLVKFIPEDEKEEGHSFYMAELKCSCCKRYNAVTFALTLNKPDFCQLCGARMDLKDVDAE